GCVLVAADWSKPLFDVAQMRALRYPLPNGDVDADSARAIQDALRPKIEAMKDGTSPVYELLPGYPGTVDARQAAGVRDQVDALAASRAEVGARRAMPLGRGKGGTRARGAKSPAATAVHVVAVGLVRALVDVVDGSPGWQGVLAYIEALDPAVARDA